MVHGAQLLTGPGRATAPAPAPAEGSRPTTNPAEGSRPTTNPAGGSRQARGNILIPKFKAGESEWSRLTRMLKDDGLIRRVWAKQEADLKAREALARQAGQRYDARTRTKEMELVSVMHLHDFLRLRQARPGFFRPEELTGNLKYLRRKADIPIFV